MSMGFGFLEFQTKEDAMKCIKTMQVKFSSIVEIPFRWA
jgi:RNA recognition motif-containing protein